MSQLTENLDRLIQKAALDGALTQKAVDMFHSVLKENDELVDKCVKLEKTQMRMGKEKKDLDVLFSQTSLKLGDYQTRERELVEREMKITTLELNAKHHEQRVVDHQFMFTTVFRNSVLRKEVMTPVEGLKADQYGTSHTPYVQKDSVEEKEE